MSAEQHIIVGIHIIDRTRHAGEVQAVFTQFGDIIKTRLGLHDVAKNYCSPNGLIVLELIPKENHVKRMLTALKKIPGIEVQTMIFSHP